MISGRLRHKITIQKPGTGKDAYGVATNAPWEDVLLGIWAEVKPMSGRERWANEHTINKATHSIRIRHRSNVTPEMRVLHSNKVYQITGVPIDPDERRKELILTCVEIQIPGISAFLVSDLITGNSKLHEVVHGVW
jgi:SPP1 family predicted phage head-tail adaptor